MVYVLAVPIHPLIDGVTVMVATIFSLPLLMAVNDGTFPVPLAGKPMAGLELVQLNVTPPGVVMKLVIGTIPPSFTIVSVRTVKVGIGLTSTVNVVVVPHCPAFGVNV